MAQEGAIPNTPSAAAGELNINRPRRASPLESLLRRLVLARLGRLRSGRLEVVDGRQRWTFGATSEEFPVAATLEVLDPGFYRALGLRGSIGAAEAYSAGLWKVDDLTALIRIFVRNTEHLQGRERWLARLRHPLSRLTHVLRLNSRSGSRRNISAHYDLSNEFFATFLDPTMMYSCAVFATEDMSLEHAQVEKVDRLCRKLDLQPGERVLEIGTGWGYFAMHAAGKYGCRVVTTTISERQFDLAKERIAAAGLEDQVEVLMLDYRDLPSAGLGLFDKLASIEMIEAVGHRYLPLYFETIGSMLEPSGLAAIQAITISDQKYDRYRRSVDFIQRHIFPGALLPSMARISECVRRRTDLRLADLEDITAYYPPTLAHWRESLLGEVAALESLGMDEPFRRLWDYYFSYCEAGFTERVIGDVQILLAKPLNRRAPLTTETR
jgi:cyclopropane-fatty-acyl-phospholipid synthase